MHGLWTDPRVFHVAQGHDELGGLSWGGKGMQRAHGFHLRRRTADLSAHRSAGARTAHAATNRLHLHERHVHAQEDARVDGLAVVDPAGICRRKNQLRCSVPGLLSEKDATEIRKGPKDPAKPTIGPTKWMYWNVHLDGLERTHDLIVEREGVFKECILAIKMAKLLGYQVATNATIYKETDMQEIEQMFDYLSDLGVDGHTITPGYDYDAAKKDMIKRLNLRPENFFLTRAMTVEKFQKVEEWMSRYTFLGTPIYFEFLAGKRDLTCSAWAIPTRNIRGWKGPCYLMTDGHYSSYAELLEKTTWDRYGVVNGVARDSRCENCMVHCGYEPTATLGLQAQRGDTWKTVKFNFGSKPKPSGRGSEVLAFNGVSSGNGHLTGKSAEVAAQAS